MTRHDLKLWHLVQVVLLSFFHVNEASRYVMMLMHQQHINQATAWLSKTVTSKCWCMYHVLTHFMTRLEQRNSSCVSKFRGSAARTCEPASCNFWARQCGLLTDTSCSHGGTGCFCAGAVIRRKGNRDIEASSMQHFDRMFTDRKSK